MSAISAKYNTIFTYVNNIRRYLYDIEDALKPLGINFILNPLPPLPDEVEPDFPRFNCVFQYKLCTIVVDIAQVRLTTTVNKPSNESPLSYGEVLDICQEIQSKIKNILADKIFNFICLYEGIVLGSESLYNNLSELQSNCSFCKSLSEKTDEYYEKNSIISDESHFLITEKRIFRAFNPSGVSISPSVQQNSFDLFIGYVAVLAVEINNRHSFNTTSQQTNNELDFNVIKVKLITKHNS